MMYNNSEFEELSFDETEEIYAGGVAEKAGEVCGYVVAKMIIGLGEAGKAYSGCYYK